MIVVRQEEMSDNERQRDTKVEKLDAKDQSSVTDIEAVKADGW